MRDSSTVARSANRSLLSGRVQRVCTSHCTFPHRRASSRVRKLACYKDSSCPRSWRGEPPSSKPATVKATYIRLRLHRVGCHPSLAHQLEVFTLLCHDQSFLSTQDKLYLVPLGISLNVPADLLFVFWRLYLELQYPAHLITFS